MISLVKALQNQIWDDGTIEVGQGVYLQSIKEKKGRLTVWVHFPDAGRKFSGPLDAWTGCLSAVDIVRRALENAPDIK